MKIDVLVGRSVKIGVVVDLSVAVCEAVGDAESVTVEVMLGVWVDVEIAV